MWQTLKVTIHNETLHFFILIQFCDHFELVVF